MSAAAIADSTHIGAIAFAMTHWSVVLAAQGESTAADEALEKLCRNYWRPLYGFARRRGFGPEESHDLTQGFFALLLERRDFDAVRQEKGRLRSYLLVAFKHFLANEHQRSGGSAKVVVRAIGPSLARFQIQGCSSRSCFAARC